MKVILLILAALLLVPAALGAQQQATLVVNSVSGGIEVSGCGYEHEAVLLRVDGEDVVAAGVFGNGCLAPTFIETSSGSHLVQAYQGRGAHSIYDGEKFLVLKAETLS